MAGLAALLGRGVWTTGGKIEDPVARFPPSVEHHGGAGVGWVPATLVPAAFNRALRDQS